MLKLSDLLRKRQEDDDNDLWSISLADMMTLLLCFFILIVAVSHVDMSRYDRVADSMEKALVPVPKPRVRPARTATRPAAPSKPAPETKPAGVRSKVSHTVLAREVVPGRKPEVIRMDGKAPDQPQPPAPPQAEEDSERTGPKRKTLEEIRKELAAKLVNSASAVELIPRDTGVALNLKGAAFFDLASAEIKPDALPLLRDIASTLAGTPYKVTVEGHTDNLPIESWLYPSNWELSSARASRVARFLIDQGVPRDHMRVEGLADTQPVSPNTDAEGRPIPENQAQNRRVVILVRP